MSYHRNQFNDQNRGRHHHRTSGGYDNSSRYGQSNYSNHQYEQAGSGYWQSEPDLYRSTSSTYNHSFHPQSRYDASAQNRWSTGHQMQQYDHPLTGSTNSHYSRSSSNLDRRDGDFRRSFDSINRSNPQGTNSSQSNMNRGPPMDLQLRTLKVTGYHQDVTKDLLKELFLQVGPVKNVVFKPDHTFIEFADEDSVAYALAAMSNVSLFDVPLKLEPKVSSQSAFKYLDHLNSYHANPDMFLRPFGQS